MGESVLEKEREDESGVLQRDIPIVSAGEEGSFSSWISATSPRMHHPDFI